MLEDTFEIDHAKANANLKQIVAALVEESRPSMLMEIARAGDRVRFIPNIEVLPDGIRYDSEAESGWKFSDQTASIARWLNFNVPKVSFFHTLTERWIGQLLAESEPALKKMLNQ